MDKTGLTLSNSGKVLLEITAITAPVHCVLFPLPFNTRVYLEMIYLLTQITGNCFHATLLMELLCDVNCCFAGSSN